MTVLEAHNAQIECELPRTDSKNLSISNKIALSGNVDKVVLLC